MTDFVQYNGKSYEVVYIDSSLSSGNNDGSSTIDALQSIPDFSSIGNKLFLIRRNNSIDWSTPPTNYIDDIIICGMPSVNNDIYDLLPSDAKTNWGSDVITHTEIILNIGSTFSSTVNFFSSIEFHNLIIKNSNINLDTLGINSLKIFNCTFDTINPIGVNTNIEYSSIITDALQIELNNSTFNTYSSISTNTIYGVNINVTKRASVIVKNCIFNSYICDNNSINITPNSISALHATDIINSSIENCTFNCYMPTHDHVVDYNHISIDSSNGFNVIKNCNFNCTSNYSAMLSVAIKLQSLLKFNSKFILENIIINDDSLGDGSLTGIRGQNLNNCVFKNITINASNIKSVTSTDCAGIFLLGSTQSNIFENININYGTAREPQGFFGSCITINHDPLSQKKGFHSIKNSKLASGMYAVNASSCNIEKTSITGSLYISGDTIDISSQVIPALMFTNQSNPFAIWHNIKETDTAYNTNNLIKIGSLTTQAALPLAINYGIANIAIENAPTKFLMDVYGNVDSAFDYTSDKGSIYIKNYPEPDYWFHRNYYHTLQASPIYHVTTDNITAGYSLHAFANVDLTTVLSEPIPAIVSFPEFKGNTISTAPCASNTFYTATIYIACVNEITTLTSDDIYIELEIPDSTIGTGTTLIRSPRNIQPLPLDTGTIWRGDNNIASKKYKIELTFNLLRSEDIHSRIYWNKKMKKGIEYCYFTPYPIMRKV